VFELSARVEHSASPPARNWCQARISRKWVPGTHFAERVSDTRFSENWCQAPISRERVPDTNSPNFREIGAWHQFSSVGVRDALGGHRLEQDRLGLRELAGCACEKHA